MSITIRDITYNYLEDRFGGDIGLGTVFVESSWITMKK